MVLCSGFLKIIVMEAALVCPWNPTPKNPSRFALVTDVLPVSSISVTRHIQVSFDYSEDHSTKQGVKQQEKAFLSLIPFRIDKNGSDSRPAPSTEFIPSNFPRQALSAAEGLGVTTKCKMR